MAVMCSSTPTVHPNCVNKTLEVYQEIFAYALGLRDNPVSESNYSWMPLNCNGPLVNFKNNLPDPLVLVQVNTWHVVCQKFASVPSASVYLPESNKIRPTGMCKI